MKSAQTCAALALIATGLSALPHEAARAAEEAGAVLPDIVYGHKDGLALTMDLFRPPGDANGGTILFMISGGWYSRWAPPQETQRVFQPYLDVGYNVFAVRHGSSPRYSIPEAIVDVQRAVRFVRIHADQWDVEAERLGVMGISWGPSLFGPRHRG